MIEKFQACLLGICIGDALGMPVETMMHEEIKTLNGGRGIIDFIDPVQFRISGTSKLKAGDTTDDWQLTAAVAHSLIQCRGWSREGCAKEHIKELAKTVSGWGRTTKRAIADIRDGKRDLDSLPSDFGPNTGCGNGVIMKIAPLALFEINQNGSSLSLLEKCLELGFLTHRDPRASLAAFVVALTICRAINRPINSKDEGVEFCQNMIRFLKRIEKNMRIHTNTVSERLERIFDCLDNTDRLRESVGCGCHALETAPFVIGTFLRHPTDFKQGVLEAVNSGGDTDTNGSIVGALIGANCGLGAIPEQWKSFRPNFAEAMDLGRSLYYIATRKNER